MAGGKLSARQKMINLMYLVFIAMLALQMSKKVLSAFGKSSQEVQAAADMKTQSNEHLLATLQQSANDQPEKYGDKYKLATQIEAKTNEFAKYMKALKDTILKKEFKGNVPEKLEDHFEEMSNSSTVDNMFFEKGKILPKGKELQQKIEDYRNFLLSVTNSNAIKENIEKRFDTKDEVHGKKGKRKEKWLMANFEGFPTITSIYKLDNYVNKAKETENEILSGMLRGQLIDDSSFNKYQAVVSLDKTAFFPGEKVTGRVALGRVDDKIHFKKVTIAGKDVPKELLSEGYIQLQLPAGNIGEKDLKGEIVIEEKGKDIKMPFSIIYAVIPPPKSAVISADKMNVLYRGVENPMSISFPGIPDNKVTVNIPGAKVKKVGSGKYNVNVTNYKGKEIKINVAGTLNGQTARDSKTFRVKNIPPPVGTVSKQSGMIKLPKRNLEIATIGAELPDFDFDIKLGVRSFNIKIPGQPTMKVNGTHLDAKAKKLLRHAKKGQQVTIFDIKAYLKGNSGYPVKKPSPVIVEILN